MRYFRNDRRVTSITLAQLHQPVALALAEIIDDLVDDTSRPDTIHDQADDGSSGRRTTAPRR